MSAVVMPVDKPVEMLRRTVINAPIVARFHLTWQRKRIEPYGPRLASSNSSSIHVMHHRCCRECTKDGDGSAALIPSEGGRSNSYSSTTAPFPIAIVSALSTMK
ncbi:hypothetical protein KCU73_g6, partial [Aureobasidium melanogenum]